jgi:hypothetical protein
MSKIGSIRYHDGTVSDIVLRYVDFILRRAAQNITMGLPLENGADAWYTCKLLGIDCDTGFREHNFAIASGAFKHTRRRYYH